MSWRSRLRAPLTTPEMQVRFKRWFDAAPIYSGSIAANRRGWQVTRTRAKATAIETRRRLRGSRADRSLAEALDRDGIVVVPSFLHPDEFARVAEAFETYAGSPRVRDIGPENGAGIEYLSGPVLSDAEGDAASVIIQAFGHNDRMLRLAEHVIGRRVRPPVRVVLQRLSCSDTVDDADREQVLHADRAYACVKAIFAVAPITEADSPFIYAKGTHRLSEARLEYERAMGVREAFLRRGRAAEAQGAEDGLSLVRGRHVMTEETRTRLGVIETAIVCPANSLIITNNAGFHRRGQLDEGSSRRTLWVNFYRYQRPWYGKLAHWVTTSIIDTDNVSRAPAAVNQAMR